MFPCFLVFISSSPCIHVSFHNSTNKR
jgi:hypothetical protein